MPSRSKKNIEAEVVTRAIALLVLSYLAIASLGLYSKKAFMPSILNASSSVVEAKPLPVMVATPTYAPSGNVVSGFPAGMIIDTGAKIASSYALNYNSSLNQYTAIFNSSKSMESLFAEYLAYFGDNGWTVTNQITKYQTSRGIYATSGNNEASVAIISQSSGLQVIVSYLVK